MTDNYAALLRQTTKIYRESLAAPNTDDMWSLAYQWQDKKHRHVFDLCKELEGAADRIEKLEAALRELSTDWDCCAVSKNMKLIARKALEGKDE